MSKAVKERKAGQKVRAAEVLRVFNTWSVGDGVPSTIWEDRFLPGYYEREADPFYWDELISCGNWLKNVYSSPPKKGAVLPIFMSLFMSAGGAFF